MKLSISSAIVLLLTACGLPQSRPEPVPLFVIAQGDDGLTQRFAQIVGEETINSRRFGIAPAIGSAEILVIVEGHVRPVSAGQFRYAIDFVSTESNASIGRHSGHCRRERMSRCARRILAAVNRILS